MLSKVFLGMALVGAEWVLYALLFLSIGSIALILERLLFFKSAQNGLTDFNEAIRKQGLAGEWGKALETARTRAAKAQDGAPDFDSALAKVILEHHAGQKDSSVEILTEVAEEALLKTKIKWEKNLTFLATVGSNAPFIGLFGTVLGIIQAFRELSEQAGAGAGKISGGLSDALVATAVGILVAIPATVAYNFFQKKVKASLQEAQALKSFLIGKLAK